MTGTSCMYTRDIQSKWNCQPQLRGGRKCTLSTPIPESEIDHGVYEDDLSQVSHGMCSTVIDDAEIVAVTKVNP